MYGYGIDRVVSSVWADNNGKTNRELLMELCVAREARVMNTWFKKPQDRKVTFAAPGTKQLPGPGREWDPAVFAELDLCIVPNRWKGMVKNVESNTKAGLNSHHFPLEITLNLKLRGCKGKRKPEALPRYDFSSIAEPHQTRNEGRCGWMAGGGRNRKLRE